MIKPSDGENCTIFDSKYTIIDFYEYIDWIVYFQSGSFTFHDRILYHGIAFGQVFNIFSVFSAIASSTSASSFIGEYATTTRYTQRSVEKTCSPRIPDLGQSNTCGEGTFDHESTCDITCDATSVTIEQTCS